MPYLRKAISQREIHRATKQTEAPAETNMIMSEPVNELEIRAQGLQRSGNHAIINWIAQQCSGNCIVLNDAPPGLNPLETMGEIWNIIMRISLPSNAPGLLKAVETFKQEFRKRGMQ